MHDLLTIEKLSAGYSKEPILKDVTLTFGKGKLYALVGPNGSGKSTLLKTLLKETQILEGKITIQGKDLWKMSQPELAKNLSFVPQKSTLPEGFSVREVLEMVSFSHPKVSEESIRKALSCCGIEALSERKVSELSGGEVQLVLLSRSLLSDRPLLLMDEPTNSLDINNQGTILRLASSLVKEGKTVIMTVHDLNSVLHYCDEVIVLKKGRIHTQGKPKEIITETMLAEIYGAKAKIHHTTEGSLFIEV